MKEFSEPDSGKLLFYTPGRVFAIFTGFEQAYPIAVRITKIRLPPQPRLIRRILFELETRGLERVNAVIEIFALEI
jgi:hypothetical protein